MIHAQSLTSTCPAHSPAGGLNAPRPGGRESVGKWWNLVYDELRELARRKMAREPAGQTLQPTALVNEAYLRLGEQTSIWDCRGHFFAAARNAMRRILVDRARRHGADKRGGQWERTTLRGISAAADQSVTGVFELEAALRKLEGIDPQKSALVKLRYLSGRTIEETADALGVSPAKVKLDWIFARAWLRRELSG